VSGVYSVIEALFEAAFYGAALLLALALLGAFGALIYFALKPSALWLWYKARRTGP
jgi:hypothetical protein